MSLEVDTDFSAEFAAEDEAIARVGEELRAFRENGATIPESEITSVEQSLREHPGPIIGTEYSVLADPEKIWKVVRRGESDQRRAA